MVQFWKLRNTLVVCAMHLFTSSIIVYNMVPDKKFVLNKTDTGSTSPFRRVMTHHITRWRGRDSGIDVYIIVNLHEEHLPCHFMLDLPKSNFIDDSTHI